MDTNQDTNKQDSEVIALHAELAQARADLGMKRDALESYAAFYDHSAAACGLVDANPGSATDEIILGRLLAYDNLRERIAELELRLDVGKGNLGDIVPFPELALRVENNRLRSELKLVRELYQACIELCREAERYVNYQEPSFMDFAFIVRQWATENSARVVLCNEASQ